MPIGVAELTGTAFRLKHMNDPIAIPVDLVRPLRNRPDEAVKYGLIAPGLRDRASPVFTEALSQCLSLVERSPEPLDLSR